VTKGPSVISVSYFDYSLLLRSGYTRYPGTEPRRRGRYVRAGGPRRRPAAAARMVGAVPGRWPARAVGRPAAGGAVPGQAPRLPCLRTVRGRLACRAPVAASPAADACGPPAVAPPAGAFRWGTPLDPLRHKGRTDHGCIRPDPAILTVKRLLNEKLFIMKEKSTIGR
jgi:hypothetical protein